MDKFHKLEKIGEGTYGETPRTRLGNNKKKMSFLL